MIPCDIPISLGEMIGIQRIRKNMSQAQLAAAVGISRNYVSLIERGNENVSYSVVLKICEVLDMEISIRQKSQTAEELVSICSRCGTTNTKESVDCYQCGNRF